MNVKRFKHKGNQQDKDAKVLKIYYTVGEIWPLLLLILKNKPPFYDMITRLAMNYQDQHCITIDDELRLTKRWAIRDCNRYFDKVNSCSNRFKEQTILSVIGGFLLLLSYKSKKNFLRDKG